MPSVEQSFTAHLYRPYFDLGSIAESAPIAPWSVEFAFRALLGGLWSSGHWILSRTTISASCSLNTNASRTLWTLNLSTTMVPQIVDFANQLRIPTAFGTGVNVRQGGLLSYGADFADQGRAAAIFVDKILHGANPADLPIEQPTVLHLTVNRTTATNLGLTIPDSVVLQVTDWVN